MKSNSITSHEVRFEQLPASLQADAQRIIAWLKARGIGFDCAETVYRESMTDYTVDEDASQRVNDKLNELGYDYSAYSMEHYIAHVEDFLGRRLELVGMEFTRSTTGACVRTAERDVVFYNDTRHKMLQEHVIIHETAHLLLNHQMMKVSLDNEHSNTSDVYRSLLSRFRSPEPMLTVRDSLLYEVNMQQEGEAEAFAKRFLAQAKAYRKHQYLTEQRNARLFPPFGSAK